jgi:HEAT repeat protein
MARNDPAGAEAMARLALHDPRSAPRTRAHAVWMLGELVSDVRTDGDLWGALANPAEDVRWAAAVVLAPTGDQRVLLVLLAGLKSGDRFRRDTVAAALASMTEDQRSRLASLAAGQPIDSASSSHR